MSHFLIMENTPLVSKQAFVPKFDLINEKNTFMGKNLTPGSA